MSHNSITKTEFFSACPCPMCNARGIWKRQTWEYTDFGAISVTATCSKCGHRLNECEYPEDLRELAKIGGTPNPYIKRSPGATTYFDDPCPYCGAYQVRYAKWKDKELSTAFWGFFSSKLHSNYKCDKCGRMWE